MRTPVNDYLLYRWRYPLGYTGIVVVVIVMLMVAGYFIPGALREGEVQSALQSGNLSLQNIQPEMVINLPYHLLQRLSFITFGVTIFSIKLPSVVLGLVASLGIFLLLRTWFRRNVAVLGTILATTTTQFLYLVQDGTADIMYCTLTIWLLFVATYVTRNKLFGTLWKVLAGTLMALALYTPLGVYLVIAVMTTALFHPHIRYIIKRFSRPKLIIAILLGIAAVAPVVYASIIDKTVLFTLLGLPLAPVNVWDNLVRVGGELFNFISPSESHILRPLYSLGLVILMGIGIAKLFSQKYTARSYITITWALLLLPLIVINPGRITYLFPIAVLMMAMGIVTMITRWYKMFPRNPYARIAGLIPLSVLVIGVVLSGVIRYANNYQYNPEVLSWYSTDLRLLRHELAANKSTQDNTIVVVSPREELFYKLAARYSHNMTVATNFSVVSDTVIVSHDAFHATKPQANDFLHNIVTDKRATNSDRFYVYKKTPR